jgi:hypothetical protein
LEVHEGQRNGVVLVSPAAQVTLVATQNFLLRPLNSLIINSLCNGATSAPPLIPKTTDKGFGEEWGGIENILTNFLTKIFLD